MYIHIGTEDKVRKGADMAHGQAGGEVGPADRKNEVRHYLDRDINTVKAPCWPDMNPCEKGYSVREGNRTPAF